MFKKIDNVKREVIIVRINAEKKKLLKKMMKGKF